MTAMERRFPHMLKTLRWEQWLRAGRMASSWESMIPHRFKSSSWRVAATFSSRTWRSSGLKLVRVTPLRFRPFRWLIFGHWKRCVKSDSVSRQLVIARLSKGVFRHLEKKKKQAIRSGKPEWQVTSGVRSMIVPKSRSLLPSGKAQYPECPLSF